jgi:hypothetical protein
MRASIRVFFLVSPGLPGPICLHLVLGFSFGETLSHTLLLFPPVAAFFVICANAQRLAQPLALFELGLGEVVDLMGFESFRVRTQIFPVLPFLIELPAQGVALVVDFIFIDTTRY